VQSSTDGRRSAALRHRIGGGRQSTPAESFYVCGGGPSVMGQVASLLTARPWSALQWGADIRLIRLVPSGRHRFQPVISNPCIRRVANCSAKWASMLIPIWPPQISATGPNNPTPKPQDHPEETGFARRRERQCGSPAAYLQPGQIGVPTCASTSLAMTGSRCAARRRPQSMTARSPGRPRVHRFLADDFRETPR